MMELPSGTLERPVKSWAGISQEELTDQVVELALTRKENSCTVPCDGPAIVAVDGRSGSGKTTLGAALANALKKRGYSTSLLATDDFAWHAPMFGWAPETIQELFDPLRLGEGVRYTPVAWPKHGRDGFIEVPRNADFVVIEGVGSSQRAFEGMIDTALWIQSDAPTARRLGIARDLQSGVNGNVEETVAFWDEWDEQELEFFENDRPWDRADFVVAGNGQKMPPEGMVLTATAI